MVDIDSSARSRSSSPSTATDSCWRNTAAQSSMSCAPLPTLS